jgi:hypothetical protein
MDDVKKSIDETMDRLFQHITRKDEANMELEHMAHQADEDREIDRDMHNEDYE